MSKPAAVPSRRGPLMALHERFEGLGIATQIGVAGGVFALVTGAVVGRWGAGGLPAAWLAAGSAALAAGIAAVLAWRTRRALVSVSTAARALARDDAPDERDIPLETANLEVRAATVQLRRMVEAARRRQRALEARNLALTSQLAHRTHELTTLQDLSIGLATKTDLHELVDEALGALEQTMEYTSASLWARDRRDDGDARSDVVLLGYRTGESVPMPAAGELTGMRLSRTNLQRYEQIERERKPLIENHARQSLFSWFWSKVTDDARSSVLYRASRSWTAVPLGFRDQVLGVMRVDHEEPGYFDPERVRLLTAVGSQTALAMRHAQLMSRERDMAVVAERNRISRELHDAVSQTLFAANLLAGTLVRTAERDPPPDAAAIRAQVQALERLNRGALAEMRLLMFELRPDALREMALADLLQQALEALEARGEVVVESSLDRRDGLDPQVRIELYRIAQEALSNVARHSGATRAALHLQAGGPGQGVLRITDNGRGFDPALPVPGHFGLENMRSRAQAIGASFRLTSVPGHGTELLVELGAAAPHE